MSKTKLKAGSLIETAEQNDAVQQPSRRQLIKLEKDFDKLPTAEVMRRVYNRHAKGIWQFLAIVTWLVIAVMWIF